MTNIIIANYVRIQFDVIMFKRKLDQGIKIIS